MHRYIDEEKASFLESIERKAGHLIASIESQVTQTSDTLHKLQEMESSLEKLSNESQLDFIRVSLSARGMTMETLERRLPYTPQCNLGNSQMHPMHPAGRADRQISPCFLPGK